MRWDNQMDCIPVGGGNDERPESTSLLLIATLATIAPAAAEDCDLKGAHWVCVPDAEAGNSFEQFLDRMHRAVDRAFTPPGGWQQNPAVPPESVPPRAATPATTRSMSQQQWKDAIIAEAEKFCAAYPNDPVCHFKDRASGGAPPTR